MQVDPSNPNEVLWLQQSLHRVLPGRVSVDLHGQYDRMTEKMVGRFQDLHGLPVTGQADAATIAKIEQELAILDGQPFKKKQVPRPALPLQPGDPVDTMNLKHFLRF
jgi:putative peptidoglycan binding protein